MKFIVLILLLLHFNNVTFGQCKCETKIIAEISTKQCLPSLVAFDEEYQIGVSINKTEKEFYLILTVRFQNSANRIASDILIFFEDEQTLQLENLDSQKDYVGGSEISNTKFLINEKAIELLKTKSLSGLRFHFEDQDIYRTFGIKRNNGVLNNQLNCI